MAKEVKTSKKETIEKIIKTVEGISSGFILDSRAVFKINWNTFSILVLEQSPSL